MLLRDISRLLPRLCVMMQLLFTVGLMLKSGIADGTFDSMNLLLVAGSLQTEVMRGTSRSVRSGNGQGVDTFRCKRTSMSFVHGCQQATWSIKHSLRQHWMA